MLLGKKNMSKFVLYLTILIVISGIILLNFWLFDKKSTACNNNNTKPQAKEIFLGRGSKKSLIKTPKGSFIKSFYKKDAPRYFREKWCYRKLADNSHFPNLIRYDDKNLTIELENGGLPLSIARSINEIERKIPDWNNQIHEIISSLEAAGIQHGDWHSSNILHKNGKLKVIDFELAQLKKEHPDDRPKPYSFMLRPPKKKITLKNYLKQIYSRIYRDLKKPGYIPPNLRH